MNRSQRRRTAARRRAEAPPPAFSADDAVDFLTGRRQGGEGRSPSGDFIFDTVHDAARRGMEGEAGVPRLIRTVRRAQDAADKAWASARSRPEPLQKQAIACRKGCAFCCHQQVCVSPAETIAIAEHVRSTFTAERFAALRARLAALDARTRGMKPSQYALTRSPCPLLEDNACSIHPVRPFRCRAYHSIDVGFCQWKLENPALANDQRRRGETPPVFPAEPLRIFDSAMRGLATGLLDTGRGAESLDLTASLRIALDLPDAGARWLGGEPVFAAAVLPPDILAEVAPEPPFAPAVATPPAVGTTS